MHALVLAAGDGDRLQLRTKGTHKSLLAIAGRPIISHVLDALCDAGVREATVVVGYKGEHVRNAVATVRPPAMDVHIVENAGYMLGNARSIWAARDALASARGFVLAMSDHIVEPGLIRDLIDGADARCRLAVEMADASDVRADEATRVLVDDESRVVAIGKDIDVWNALDTGTFWCTQAVFDALSPRLRDGEAGAVFARLAARGELDAVDVTGRAWIDIDTPDDLHAAEVMIRSRAHDQQPAAS